MKILWVCGDDYAASKFQDGVKSTKWLEIWLEVDKAGGEKEMTFEIDGQDEKFLIQSYQFGQIDPKFIEFLRDIQDYDDSKHDNWFRV